MTTAARVARGMGWLLGASFAVRGLAALSMLILTRILAPEDFGLVALATTLLAILAVITEFQLSNALIQMRDVRPHHFATVFTLQMGRGVIVAVALFAGGHVLAGIYAEPRLIGLASLLMLDPIVSGLRSPRFAVYDKELRFAYGAALETSARTAAFAVTVAVALATRSYWAIPLGQIAATAAICIGSHVAAPFRPRFSLEGWRSILHFSVWLNLIGIASTLSSRLDNFFVVGFLNKAMLGQYVVGNQLAMLVSEALLAPLQRTLFPGFATAVDDPDRLRAIYARSQAGLTSVGLPAGVLIALMAAPGVELFLGSRWTVATQVIEWVAPVFGIQMVFGPVNALALALGQTKALFWRSFWNLVVRLPAILLGLHYGGLTGLLLARFLVGGVFLGIMNAALVSRLIGISPGRQMIVGRRSAASAAVMLAAGLIVRTLIPVPHDRAELIAYFLALGTSLPLLYVAAHAALWQAAGRPAGAERDVAALAGSLFRRAAGRRHG